MNQRKILHVSAEPIFNLGGVGKIVQWLAGGLAENYRISVASPQEVVPASALEFVDRMENRILIPSNKWDKASKAQFVERVMADGYDLVHFHGGTFSFDAHLPWRSPLHSLCGAGVPWINSNHCAPSLTEGLFPPRYRQPAKFLKSVLAWSSKCYLLTHCRQEVFDSDENRGQIARWFPWAGSKMRTIYHSGLEGTPPSPGLSTEVSTIANLGHIGWRKGQHDLLAAFAILHKKHPRIRLILAGPEGEAECAHWLRAEIARQKLADFVEMPGGLVDKTAFWRSVDIYVQPSRYEGAPMSLMEALWMGKPAVGTRVSGIPEIIQHEVNGLLVEPGQPAKLAAAMERLIVEFDTRRRFNENGGAHIQNAGMTRKNMIQNYIDLYEMIFADTRPR
jgi:glycosyltransferase involved in cell wall biosynthesis